MGIILEESGDSCVLKVDGQVTVRNVEELRDNMLRAIDKYPVAVVDVTAVEAIDVSVLQLLCAAHKSAVAKGHVFKFSSVPQLIAEVATEAGFTNDTECMKTLGDPCLWMFKSGEDNG
jgi:anti-anti-sigma regulatory factor